MNIRNRLVSPQFHVQHDDRFDTVVQNAYESTWQLKAGFINIATKRKRDEEMNEINKKQTKRTSTKQQLEMERLSDQKEAESQRRKDQNESRDERQRKRESRKDLFNVATPEGAKHTETEGVRKAMDIDNTSIRREIHGLTTDAKEIQKVNAMSTVATNDSELEESEILCMEAMFPDHAIKQEDPIVAYKAVADPDVMYLHQAMREKDKLQFIKAMKKEVHDQKQNGNFIIVRKDQVPSGKTILKSVWQMRRKRNIKMRAIKKYKAHLNVDGSRMKHGID